VAEVHGRSQDVGRLKTALGWRRYEIKSGRNHSTRSRVRGMTRLGIEVGQDEQIQRVEVSDLWGTLRIWTMPVRVDDK
jgi:hypothetical protein